MSKLCTVCRAARFDTPVRARRGRVGTSADNTRVLDDDLGSHRHCGISPTAASVRGRDEGLENGTFVGAVRVADATYSEPFGLRLGQTVLAITPLERDRREQSTTDRFGDVLCSAASACAQCQAKVDAWREEAS